MSAATKKDRITWAGCWSNRHNRVGAWLNSGHSLLALHLWGNVHDSLVSINQEKRVAITILPVLLPVLLTASIQSSFHELLTWAYIQESDFGLLFIDWVSVTFPSKNVSEPSSKQLRLTVLQQGFAWRWSTDPDVMQDEQLFLIVHLIFESHKEDGLIGKMTISRCNPSFILTSI